MKKILDTLRKKWAEYIIEAIVITVSIFGALILNNWNENQKTNELEYKLLSELHKSTKLNIDELNRGIEMVTRAQVSCEIILSHLENNLNYRDSLDKHFSQSIFWYRPLFDFSSFETSKNYGLHLFRNDSLRTLAPFIYESRMDWIRTQEERNNDFFYGIVTPIVLKLFSSSNMWHEIRPHDFSKLKNQKDYISMLRTLTVDRQRDIYWFEQLRDQLERLELVIRSELDKN